MKREWAFFQKGELQKQKEGDGFGKIMQKERGLVGLPPWNAS